MVTLSHAKFNYRLTNQSTHRDGARVAGVRFGDTLRSTRSTSGIHYQTRSILWSEAILRQAQQDGITELEVIVTDAAGRSRSYRAPLAVMLARGTLAETPAGLQRSLTLDAWQTSRSPMTPSPASTEPTPAPQLGLFAEVAA